jgi:uncharacterized protein
MYILNYTHGDEDGLGSYFILTKVPKFKKIDVEYHNYNTIDKEIIRLFDSGDYKKYDKIIMTDLSIKEETAEYIDPIIKENKINFFIIDHHQTAEKINKYEWTWIAYKSHTGIKNSGTKMVYDYFSEFIPKEYSVFLFNFVKYVTDYDTYKWKDDKNLIPRYINDIYKFYGKDLFLEHIEKAYQAKDYKMILGENEMRIVNILNDRFDKFYKDKMKSLKRVKFHDYNIGIVFAEDHISELGNAICDNNLDLDFVAMINLNHQCVYFRGIRNDIHLGFDVAEKYFGGGGQDKTAGAPIKNIEVIEQCMSSIFNNELE